jgi:hypothetical protein
MHPRLQAIAVQGGPTRSAEEKQRLQEAIDSLVALLDAFARPEPLGIDMLPLIVEPTL